MATAKYRVDAEGLENISEAMEKYGAGAGQIVDGVLQGEGAMLIKGEIAKLLPRSGRKWKKKGAPAAVAMPAAFTQQNSPLAVTISARGKYGYLYYPDDGSNTRRHAGNQQFMRRGAEAATERIIDLCVGKLTEGMV